ncbi:MAG: exodeoxyribonuclease VII small subunit [bacterium]
MSKRSKQSFAESFAKLSEIASYFEEGEIDVEEGLKKFEEGLALAEICKTRLKEIENRVVELKKQFESSEDKEEDNLNQL